MCIGGNYPQQTNTKTRQIPEPRYPSQTSQQSMLEPPRASPQVYNQTQIPTINILLLSTPLNVSSLPYNNSLPKQIIFIPNIIIIINLQPILLNNEDQKNLDIPLPTDPSSPTNVRNWSSWIVSLAYNLQLVLMNKLPQLPKIIIKMCIQNTLDRMASLLLRQCPVSFFSFCTIVWEIIVFSIFSVSLLKSSSGRRSKLPTSPVPKYSTDRYLTHDGTPSVMCCRVGWTYSPSMGSSLSGLRKLIEKRPKTTEPSPVPIKINPLTQVCLLGKQSLQTLIGTIKVIPAMSPNPNEYNTTNTKNSTKITQNVACIGTAKHEQRAAHEISTQHPHIPKSVTQHQPNLHGNTDTEHHDREDNNSVLGAEIIITIENEVAGDVGVKEAPLVQ